MASLEERPDRPADRIVFIEQYKPSGRTQKISRATQMTRGTKWASPTVTEWTEREEEVPGWYETLLCEIWYTEDGQMIAFKNSYPSYNKYERLYQKALQDQNYYTPVEGQSTLMRAVNLVNGWGKPGFSFWVTDPSTIFGRDYFYNDAEYDKLELQWVNE